MQKRAVRLLHSEDRAPNFPTNYLQQSFAKEHMGSFINLATASNIGLAFWHATSPTLGQNVAAQ
jgi:hypothetical protein